MNKPSVKFPKKLCAAIAGITQDFSFAYLKEAFVSTLIVIASNRSENGISGGDDDEGGDLDDYELWREMKKQVKLLRNDMGSKSVGSRYEGVDASAGLSWRAMDTSIVPPSDPPAALPFRPRGGRGGRSIDNSPLMTLDCDANNVPLMTDGDMFLDSRFD